MESFIMEAEGEDSEGSDSQLDEFYLFRWLPEELQLIIWDLWREDQPVFHHHLFLTEGGRCYAALDTVTHQVVDAVSHSADLAFDGGAPLDPSEHKLYFKGEVMTITQYKDLEDHKNVMAWNLEQLPYKPQSKDVNTWLHMKTDMFIFWSTYKFPGHLRYLCDPFDVEPASDINKGDWSHHIQQVGIYVPNDGLPLCEFDRRTFSQLRNLRNVFLIIRWKRRPMPVWWPLPLWRFTSGKPDVLIKPSEIIEFVEEFHLPEELEQYRSQELDYLRKENTKAETLRTQLLQVFQNCKREYIAVETMLEALS
ncbi:hypothetical protein F4782DRAFT_547495 [Xylaria castorea]|nr:hypothetical protein F4782DRAFT_547495 [Xylaria castorea]